MSVDRKQGTPKLLCDVFKTPRYPDMYLYVVRDEGMSRVRDELLARFDDPELALSFTLTRSRKLAIADSATVFDALLDQGYYLQMPPITSMPVLKV
ncbi:MAG: hypothetical protein CMQ05_18620 [Gammaproteobacteria bacterium]|uniref:YcgL domain-containing protein n=1 Tax=OM182 bacterium MED-G24 TaxID=1986255 RepID=A0A2A5WUJ0_9GAMM|nr:hypothetical protein [Gammaproteobacteria bacterium]PDH39923.1 MAG: hypothetical protein CNE99_04530 [OM182 bacterium MED-G24]RPG23753.1 MAG: hypothetical protein CBC10_013865 [Gammaproteobacteria bacterium TMED50]|tara:strand:- start:13968 stop:14255 length:288 start_codon:yes stop_codon:yes gene_type:complete